MTAHLFACSFQPVQRLRQLMQWFNLALIFGLLGLVIAGSFLGAERAKELFNSPPLWPLWGVLALALLAGFIIFVTQMRNPGLAALHAGCLLILLGSFWNSHAGHTFAARLGLADKIPWSYLVLREGEQANVVWDETLNQPLGQLPFSVRLNKFSMDFYPQRNVEFEPAVKQYRSDVGLYQGSVGCPAEITVNHPLHFNGYHLYQMSWGRNPELYSVLLVASDSGLYLVYTGFVVLVLGAAVRFWFRRRVPEGGPAC
ncbi:MAG: cytochrome c biogenesis protein ResB [Kiritimatiellaeota bacterium]|nr:cytochrome c biogenesis protein ResB [Kiritimatiellota bacterium]